MAIDLTFKDRAALVWRAIAGTLPMDTNTVGGRLLAGVVQSGGQPPPRGVAEHLNAYNHMPWLRAVISRVSFDVASTPWQLFVKQKGSARAVLDGQVKTIQRANHDVRMKLIAEAVEAGELRQLTTHPMLDLLDNFNTFHTGLSGRRVTMQHMDLTGEAFWLIERDARGMPIALWPIPPNWVKSTPTVRRPTFRVSFRAWQGEIPATEFVWFNELDPANPYGRGSGTSQALGDELETDEYAARHAKAFFFNRARPDLIVSPKNDESMEDHEVRRLEEGWTRASSGFWRGFKPFFLRRAVDVKEIDQSFRAQQFIQLREFERNTCIQVFGVSPEIFGIVAGGANRATIKVAEYIYGKRVLVPRLEQMRATLQERLIPEFDERLIANYTSPVGADEEQALEAAKAAPWALTIDEWRYKMDAPALENGAGELHMVPAGVTPMKFDDDLLLSANPKPDPNAEDPNAPNPDDLDDDDLGDEERGASSYLLTR